MTTLREEFGKFVDENYSSWLDEAGDGNTECNPDFDSIADFFISKMRGMIEGKRRTDETQMSEDHAYDEALDDLLTEIGE